MYLQDWKLVDDQLVPALAHLFKKDSMIISYDWTDRRANWISELVERELVAGQLTKKIPEFFWIFNSILKMKLLAQYGAGN